MKKLYVFLLAFAHSVAYGQDTHPPFLDAEGVPIPTHHYVNDFTNGEMLDTSQLNALEKKLKDYEDSTTSQIVIVCLPTLPSTKQGGTWGIEDLAVVTGRTWKVGQVKSNNGVVLLISLDSHEAFIATGYGMEKKLPDFLCQRIVEKDIVPYFKEEEYYEGLDKATTSMSQLLSGTYAAVAEKEDRDDRNFWFLFWGIAICGLFSAFVIWPGAIAGGIYVGIFWFRVYDPNVWIALLAFVIGVIVTLIAGRIILAILNAEGGSGSSSGGSSSSGSSSSGFSGGGGSFGGGGGGGKW